MANTKRKDKSRKVLRKGESQRPDGTYQFRWTDENRKRHCIYARNLDDLRYKEDEIDKDKKDGIKAEARYTSLNDMYELWRDLKRGIKNNTFENYKYMYETFVRNQIGSQFIMSIKKTDIKRYYNSLVDERHLKPATIDSIHTVLHQVFEMAVDDDYIRSNPTDNVLRELKKSHCFKTEKRRALTKPEQELFLNYLKNTPEAQYWYPIFAVMVGTGLRVGELTGLRWCDIDLEETPSISDYEDAEEQVDECRQYTVEEIFCCAYAPYFWQAIQIRYPEYATYNHKLYALLGGTD